MSPRIISTRSVSVAGTFNEWNASDGRAQQIAEHQFEFIRDLGAGRHAFKWKGDEEHWWGGRGTESVMTPTSGAAVSGGEDIVLNLVLPARVRFNLDLRTRRWVVDRPSDSSLLEGAIWPHNTLQGSFGQLLEALRQGADGQAFGYAWNRWEQLQPFLTAGMWRGFFPIRDGNRALFLLNEALPQPLFLAGNINDWSVGADPFTRVAGTDVHLLYREWPPDLQLHYKLVCGDRWFTDYSNRWVTPDGQTIPMFQTGHFNSVVDLGAPPTERGDNLLWVPFPSVLRNHTRDIYISLPRGYATQTNYHYPVLYVQDGNEAVTRAHMHVRARQALESAMCEPCIVVFVGLSSQMDRGYEYEDLEGRLHYSDFLARELVPFIDSQLRTRAEAAARGLVGASYGGLISFYIGWRHPDLFGKVGGQGTSFWVNDWEVLRLYTESPRRRLQLYLDSASPSYANGPRDNYVGSRYAEKELRSAGYHVRHVQRKDQRHDWPSWQERFPEVLRTFWPP